jgi:hypothetical protein
VGDLNNDQYPDLVVADAAGAAVLMNDRKWNGGGLVHGPMNPVQPSVETWDPIVPIPPPPGPAPRPVGPVVAEEASQGNGGIDISSGSLRAIARPAVHSAFKSLDHPVPDTLGSN